MYLKRIEIQGFKSFADKITIEVGPGVTGIVGPNGSGKSNISDALRWVMGEQSAKSLRSGKMEDVIFSGTQKRKPLSFAEVKIVLDNESRFFASDYNEIAVTRRVFRSGESEYLINGAQCRLKDVHELFMDTGLGREGYSVVGQGKIDEIISSKGEDRRQVFEEAAGISKYRHRKIEAERKLEKTEENLVRVRDVLTELEARVEPLEKQSEKARKYLKLREELKGIEISASVCVIDKNKEEEKRQDELLKGAQGDLENEKNELEKAEGESEELYKRIRENDEKTAELRRVLDEKRREAGEKSGERSIVLNNIENDKKSAASLEGEIASGERLLAEENENLKNASALRREAEQRLEAAKDAALKAESVSGIALSEMNEAGVRVEETRSRQRELEKRLSDAQNVGKGLELLEENIAARLTENGREAEKLSDEKKELEKEYESLKEHFSEKEEEYKRFSALFDEAEKAARDAGAGVEQKKSEFNRLSASVGEKQGRLRTLEEMERALEGYQRSVKELIRAHGSGRYKGRITGILSKLIKTPREYSTAIEIALGAATQNIVVPEERDAKEAVEYLKKNNLGRATFLPLSSQEKRRLDNERQILGEKGVVGIASDLVEREGYLDNTVEALLGRCVVTRTQDDAIELAKKYRYRFKIVTLTGEEFRVGGSITGGSLNRAVSVLGRAEELADLKRELKGLIRASEKAEDEIALLTEKAAAERDRREDARKRVSECEIALSRFETERRAVDKRIGDRTARIAELKSERESIEKRIETNEALKKEGVSETEKVTGELEELQKELNQRQEEHSRAIEKKDIASDEVFKRRMALSETEKDIALFDERIGAAKKRIEEIENEGKTKRAATENLKRETELLSARAKELSEEEEALKRETEKLEGEVLAAKEGRSGTDERLAFLRGEIKRINDVIYSLQGECARLESAKSRISYNIENAVNRLWDEYEITYTQAKEQAEEIESLPEAQKKVSSLRGAIRNLGNVNVDAIEEYKEVKERYEFLSSQVGDMEGAKESLEKLIKEITGVMKDIFAERFKFINESFGEIFKELFGGGSASVSLEDEGNILESGIEIEVQPPGKKLQSIDPLSGGEKALTAIALLFALMKASPSPFVVLDEIEASLDDINVYRFAQYMRRRTDTTQFVVITHRRGTMEATDMLYGVTMQEKGVSKLLSMRLDDVTDDEAV